MSTTLIPDAWHPLKWHPEQQRLVRSTKRYCAVVAGRGSGKTEFARRKLVLCATGKQKYSDAKYFFVGPTSDQAERIGWKPILKLIPPSHIQTKHENKKVITLTNGAEIHVCSGQKPERLEGVQWDGGIVDESSDQSPTLFKLNLGPAMTHRNAWCWRIGVPKRRGVGAKDFREFFDRGVDGDPNIDSFHWMSGDILAADKMQEMKDSLSPQDYREQYEASWEIATGLAFPDFSDHNITERCVYRPDLPIIVGSDFNVDPMAWGLFHFINGDLLQFDEIYLRGTNTQKTLDHLNGLYNDHNTFGQPHRAGWCFVGDASSTARKTSASTTDYLLIKNDPRFTPKKIAYPRKNPPIADRLNTMNAAIFSASGKRRYFVHPDCKMSIMDLQNRHYKTPQEDKPNPGGVLNDVGDLGHITDAIGYTIWRFLPMRLTDDGDQKEVVLA